MKSPQLITRPNAQNDGLLHVDEAYRLLRGDVFDLDTRVDQNLQHVAQSIPADLSGSATTQYLFHAKTDCQILRVDLLYTEASSADAGVTLEIGKESDRDYFYTGASEGSKAQWYEKNLTLLNTDLDEGDTMTFYSPGGKAGAGEVLAIVEYLELVV